MWMLATLWPKSDAALKLVFCTGSPANTRLFVHGFAPWQILFGLLKHEHMILGNMAVHTVDHPRVSVSGQASNDMGIHASEELSSHKGVAQAIVGHSFSQHMIELGEGTLDREGRPRPLAAVDKELTLRSLLGKPPDNVHASLGWEVEYSGPLAALGFLFGNDGPLLCESEMTRLQFFDLERTGT